MNFYGLFAAPSKLKNLKEYLPGQQDFIYDFADYLWDRANDDLVPQGFNLMAELAIYDLQNGVDWYTNKPIAHKVAWYPPMMYAMMRMFIPQISKALFWEEFGNVIKWVQDEVFKAIKDSKEDKE